MARLPFMTRVDRSRLEPASPPAARPVSAPPIGTAPIRSPFFHCSLLQPNPNLDQLTRQFYIGGAVPQSRIFTRGQ